MVDRQYGRDHQRRREGWQHHLETIGPVLCVEGCGKLVHADPAMNWDGKPWHLCHGVAAHHGGDGKDSAPGHQTCNLQSAHLIATTKPLTTYTW